MAKKIEKKKGIVERMRGELSEGIGVLGKSFDNGSRMLGAKYLLCAKYSILIIVLAILYAFAAEVPFAVYTVFLPLAVLLLMFNHELFSAPVSNKMNFAHNALVLALLMLAIFVLFTFKPDGGEEASLPSIIASSLSMLLLALFLFMPIYMVRSGSTGLKSMRNSFSFVARNAMKTMFYVLSLLMLVSLASSIPAMVGLAPISAVLFIYFLFGVFVMVGAYWEACRGK